MSDLERDLEELEASDPAVGEAAARLDETTAAIVARAVRDAHLNGESTSARLRRVEQERDEMDASMDRMAKDHIKLLDRNIRAEAELASARTELNGLRAANDQLRADYSAAADELEQLRYSGWIVARGDVAECASCWHWIRRGEAYSVSAISDSPKHVLCPSRGDTDA